MSRLTTALLAAAFTVAGSIAHAQTAPTFDPAQLPAIKGKVAQYLPTPRGEVDGLLLDDGTEVHVPPHLSTQLVFAIHPGDSVTIHGLKARAAPMVAASSITNDATNVTIVDGGPHMPREANGVEVSGKVKAVLHGHRGDIDGVLLDDGSVVHLPPPEAKRLAAQLAVGQPIVARGDGFAGVLGKSIGAHEIGPDSAHLTAIHGPRPGWEHGGMHDGAHDGPGHHGGMMGEPDGGPGAPPPPAQ